MKVSDIFPQVRSEKVKTDKRVPEQKNPETTAEPSVLPDRIDLSAGSKEIQKVRDILRNTPEVRADRVAELKEKIERNEYDVDPRKIADRMLYSLITDHITLGE